MGAGCSGEVSVATDDPSTDTIHSILDNVTCTSGTTIRIAMAYWSTPRAYLVDKLESMVSGSPGCDVRILIDDANTAIIGRLAQSPALSSRYKVLPSLHHKYLLIDADSYAGSPRRYVWTGSKNYTGPALRENDETLLRINSGAVYTAFLANWDDMNGR